MMLLGVSIEGASPAGTVGLAWILVQFGEHCAMELAAGDLPRVDQKDVLVIAWTGGGPL